MFYSHFKFVDNPTKKLFIIGKKDNFTPVSTLESFLNSNVSEPKTFLTVEGVDHFLFGYEQQVLVNIVAFLTQECAL